MDRRNVVKSLLTLPLLGLIKPTAVGQNQPARTPSGSSPSPFKLVFHGPFCFYRLPDGGYLAAAPDLKTHDLLYGSQIKDLDQLKPLSGDQYVLAQTRYSVSQSLNEQRLVVLHGKYTLDPDRIRCHIYLPAPLSIEAVELFSLASPQAPQAPFQGGAAKSLNQRTHVATGTLFMFERKGGIEPYIRDLWNGKDGDILHFIAKEKTPDSSNPNDTFKEMVQAVRGLDLKMALKGPLPADDHEKGIHILNCLAPAIIIQE